LSEILFVQANTGAAGTQGASRFQSLERDSVCSSYYGYGQDITAEGSFNLLSEILFVQARCDAGPDRVADRFNLLSEILFVQAQSTSDPPHHQLSFQSLERDSVCSS